jgi:hypothetical protein
MASNMRALRKVHRAVECYWRKMLEQPERARHGLLQEISADQETVPSAETQAVSPVMGRCKL